VLQDDDSLGDDKRKGFPLLSKIRAYKPLAPKSASDVERFSRAEAELL
jgi:hypothetical protein